MDEDLETVYNKGNWKPTFCKSRKWHMWKSVLSDRTCDICRRRHGKVVSRNAPQIERPPVHPNCKCRLVMFPAVLIGTMTQAMKDGVEVYYAQYGELPYYYLTKEQAEFLGWTKKEGNLNQILPGAMIGGDIYQNKDGKLPNAQAGSGTRRTLIMILGIGIVAGFSIPTMD